MSGAETSLLALDVISLDTETTSLDAKRGRIVQIGACRVAQGRLMAGSALDMLVNPGKPIPEVASRIHGISDERVAAAPRFPEAWASLRAFVGERVLVGHTIAYDLTILQHECSRYGIAWLSPHSLCVRLLAQIAKPDLPDHSLETIAAWMDIKIVGRHTALGDATAAAEIFIALLPRLRARGIRTLGEAIRAQDGSAGQLKRATLAGWSHHLSPPQPRPVEVADPYAYRHRVADVMASPPAVVRSDSRLSEAIRAMTRRGTSSLLVSQSGDGNGPACDYGIVTERDVMRSIAHDETSVTRLSVGELATRPVISIEADAFVYRAIGRMNRLNIRHLAVRDRNQQFIGMVSARDVVRLRAATSIDLEDHIDQSEEPADLAQAWSMLPAVVQALLAEGLPAHLIAEIVSDELCALTRRAAILAERAMADEGLGGAPCSHTVMVMGSAGRGESLLAADQDNAIVFARGDEDGPEDRWFAQLGARMAEILDMSGVPLCKGGVMASNAAFRGSLALWKRRVEGWVRHSRPEDLLNIDIAFDLRPVHGDTGMGEDLFRYAHATAHAHPVFAMLLGERVMPSNPFNILGRLRLEAGRVDLKRHALYPMVAATRALSIRHGMTVRSTRERLQRLVATSYPGSSELEAVLEDHQTILKLLFMQQSRDLRDGIAASNRVVVPDLSRAERDRLYGILRSVQRFPDLVRDLMFPSP